LTTQPYPQAPPRPLSRRPRRAGRAMPGWDAQGGEWAEMDALAEQEELDAEAARNAGGSVGALTPCRGSR